jgi:SsrA-binding protein
MATLIENKKVRLDYEILESYEAGIELLGLEVKSLRAHQGSLLGSHVLIRGGEAYLVNADIPAYQKNNTPTSYNPLRNRRLLLHKADIMNILALSEKKGGGGSGKGLTIVPVSMYSKDGKIKAEIAIVRGKKKHDKRQALKKRETEREISRKFNL